MKTQTRALIIQLIEKNGKSRPIDLRKELHISAQALHRQLRSLVDQGIIEAHGSAPFTEYVRAGVPHFDRAFEWMSAPVVAASPEDLVCENRDIFTARLPRLKIFVKEGLPERLLPQVISTVGEIGNNSFDHNLGQWRDVPGCWFECQKTGGHLWICMGDRGQGIFQSLVKVHPELTDEQMALNAAFETIISGRAPEQRGNGLKYVKKNLMTTPGGGLACLSGGAHVFYGEQGQKCMSLIHKRLTQVKGTLTLMVWRLK